MKFDRMSELIPFQSTMHQRGDLTRDSQLIYLSQWLGEFSEVERDDFLQELLDLYAPGEFQKLYFHMTRLV